MLIPILYSYGLGLPVSSHAEGTDQKKMASPWRCGEAGGPRAGKLTETQAPSGCREAASSNSGCKRLKARVGGQYQARIAEIKLAPKYDPGPRRLPQPLTNLEPFESASEYEKSDLMKEELAKLSSIKNDSTRGESCSGESLQSRDFDTAIRREAVCVNRARAPRTDLESTIFRQFLAEEPYGESLECGESLRYLADKYESPKHCHKNNKRKLGDHRWATGVPTEKGEQNSKTTGSYPQQARLVYENEASILEYRHRKHNGDLESADWSTRTLLSCGRASKSRRLFHEHLRNSLGEEGQAELSWCWRQRFETIFHSVHGDLRSNPNRVAYPRLKAPDKTTHTHHLIRSQADPTHKTTLWKSVLAHGQAMERVLRKDQKGTERPTLAEAIAFVRDAYSLPAPEDVFGFTNPTASQIATTLHFIIDQISVGKDAQVRLTDFVFDEEDEGIDLETMTKLLDELSSDVLLILDDEKTLRREIETISLWQSRVDHLLSPANAEEDQLAVAEMLIEESSRFGLRPKGVVLLEKRICKAILLRERIRAWNMARSKGQKESPKHLAALVREAHRIDLHSNEVRELLRFHCEVDCWIDRATVAIRSRIALGEIESLISQADRLSLDFSDYLVKLNARVSEARTWMARFEEVIPRPVAADEGQVNYSRWMQAMRKALCDEANEGDCGRLQELAIEGGRISVEVEAVKLLQIEIDSKGWAVKARKWIPREGSSDAKKGKLDDLREHAERGDYLREKIPIESKHEWTLEGEPELKAILNTADEWLAECRLYLGDGKVRTGRRLSMKKLRATVLKGNAIHANLGTITNKVNRLLVQAEGWFEKHAFLLGCCGITNEGAEPRGKVTLNEIDDVVASASNDIPVNLEEVFTLSELAEKTRNWLERSHLVVPKRTKRSGKGKRATNSRHTVGDLIQVIEEANSLPINVEPDVQRLQLQLRNVLSWQQKARNSFKEIEAGFRVLRESISLAYGNPKEFYNVDGNTVGGASADNGSRLRQSNCVQNHQPAESTPAPGVGSHDDSPTGVSTAAKPGVRATSVKKLRSNPHIHRMISTILSEMKQTGIVTSEEEIAVVMEKISDWCSKSLRFIESPRLVFEKKSFKSFDNFVDLGEEFINGQEGFQDKLRDGDVADVLVSWNGLVADQLERLRKLRAHRDEFIGWCREAQRITSRKQAIVSVERLEALAKQSRRYPSTADMVQKVRHFAQTATKCRDKVRLALRSEKKLSLQESKALCDEAEQLNIDCEELRMLKNAMKSVRGWLNRLKKRKFEQITDSPKEIEALIDEHESFAIVVPEEAAKLRQLTKRYCICRRPYDGFMIGCDGCDEWYHGACIGVSESQAGRVDKFLCVRCCLVKIFKGSSVLVASTIKKWTNHKHTKKARQVEAQKHQRKVRKEKKDIEKLNKQIEGLQQSLHVVQSVTNPVVSVESSPQEAMHGGTETCPLERQADQPLGCETGPNTVLVQPPVGMVQPPNTNDITQGPPPTVTPRSSEDSAGVASSGSNAEERDEPASRKELESKLERALAAKRECEERLASLAQRAEERLKVENEEDRMQPQLREWCIRVRSQVLVPETEEGADAARPPSDGSLSSPMLKLLRDADDMVIAKLPDVHSVANAFKCIAWSFLALAALAKKPSLKELQHVIARSVVITLPDEKALRMMKGMVQKTTQWQSKVRKALAPKPGDRRPYELVLLANLKRQATGLPLEAPELFLLMNTIDEKGKRYCVCGGPNDGSFMLSCDKCGEWFHGRCVGVNNSDGESLKRWLCPECSDSAEPAPIPLANPIEWGGESDENVGAMAEESFPLKNVPTPLTLWPPFGLLNSAEALEMIGEVCATRKENAPHDPTRTASSNKPIESSPNLAGCEGEVGTNRCLDCAGDKPVLMTTTTAPRPHPTSNTGHMTRCMVEDTPRLVQ